MSESLKPAMHRDFAIGDRVTFDQGGVTGSGRIAGVVSNVGQFISYIVILDKPLTVPAYEGWEACAILGQCMELKGKCDEATYEIT